MTFATIKSFYIYKYKKKKNKNNMTRICYINSKSYDDDYQSFK